MNELFVRFFLSELRKAGFSKAFYDREQDRVVISPEYSRLFVAFEEGEYLVHYDKDSRFLLPVIKSIRDETIMVTVAWEQSAQKAEDVARFRNLLEWNGVTLSARDDGARGLHFVTWQYDRNRKVERGNYTESIGGAMRDFAGRSGLIPKELIFDGAQLDLIRSALAYRLENDGEIYPDTEREIKSVIDALDTVKEEKAHFTV